MLIPIRHENMSARRWPVVTLALIVINVVAFLGTNSALQQQSPEVAEVRAHILMLAAMHPELTLTPDAARMVQSFRKNKPDLWNEISNPNRDVADPWDANMRLIDDPERLQQEMDSLTVRLAQFQTSSLLDKYAFIPARHAPLTYITANFLHGGWLHIIFNMWFLWLAGFVLEDSWGRVIYTIFYFVAGAVALQVHLLSDPASLTPTLGASGAVAGLMGAFLVRFPKMKIEMMWLVTLGFRFRTYRFKMPAYALLPLWLLTEVFYGAIFGSSTGVAHWAHVGGFVFGAVVATGIRFSGLEHQANKAIEEKIGWTNDPAITEATELIEKGQRPEAVVLLKQYLDSTPDSIDGWSLLQHAYWDQGEIAAYHQALLKLCELHMKAREPEPAWENYEDFIKSGGVTVPAALWFDLCRFVEGQQNFERALTEYEKLAVTHPEERQGLLALMAAARICLKNLNRPQDALKFFQAASSSKVPHLDFEGVISAGIREAGAGAQGGRASAAGAT